MNRIDCDPSTTQAVSTEAVMSARSGSSGVCRDEAKTDLTVARDRVRDLKDTLGI